MHVIILADNPLTGDKVSAISRLAATVDVVSRVEDVSSKVNNTKVDAIVIVENGDNFAHIVRKLRENSSVDGVPILTVKSPQDLIKIVPALLKSKL